MEIAHRISPHADTPRMDVARIIPASSVRVAMEEPVVVSMADPAERTWGYWQFPTISRMPGGGILLTVNNSQDDDLCYGHPSPSWVSHDDGVTWRAEDLDEKGLTISHSPVAELHHGEFLCVPMPLGFSPTKLSPDLLKNPVAESHDYIRRAFFRMDPFPPDVKAYFSHLRGLRWTPATRRWTEERVAWDMRGALLRLDDGGMIGKAWSRTSLEYRPLRMGDELLDANYKTAYMHDDGSAPKGFEVVCHVSRDNGRSWERRGIIAQDPTGKVPPTETAMSPTRSGRLVCVVRTTDYRQLPMWLTHSDDRGKTWSSPRALFDHGVLPQLELLGNGVLALAYGRPGVHLSFSPDGEGREWTGPVEVLPTGLPPRNGTWTWEEILEASAANEDVQKDGYTSIVPLAADSFLIAYCDLARVDARGRKRKAVLTRRIRVDC